MKLGQYTLAFFLVVASPCAAGSLARSYLTFNGGFDVLTTNVAGDVVRNRVVGLVELGVGHQFHDSIVLEFTYGWLGRHEKDPPIRPLMPSESGLTDAERAFQVTVNPMILRARYARDGHRQGYFKPEFSLGLGFFQTTRLLRNIAIFPPEERSQLLPAVEVGASAFFVFSKNFMGWLNGRYSIMRRRDIVDDTEHFDGFSVVMGFRTFLPSPRDQIDP